MVEYPDLGVERRALQSGTQVVGNEPRFIFLRPQARRHQTVLVGIDFILHRGGVDLDSFGSVAL